MQKKNSFFKYVKAFAIALALVMTCVSAFAEAALPSAEIDSSTLNIKYTETGSGYGTFIYVFDTKIAYDTVIDETLTDEHLVYARVGKDGEASFALSDDAEYGVYTVILGARGMSAAKEDRTIYVLYKDPDIDAIAGSAISGAADADALVEQIEAYNDQAYIIDTTNIDDVKDILFGVVGEMDEINGETLASAIKSSKELASIAGGEVSDIEAVLTSDENKALLGVDDDIDAVKTTVAAALSDELTGDESFEEIKSITNEILAVAVLNDSVASQVLNVIEKYNNVFDVTFSSKLSDINEYEIKKFIASYNFTNPEDVEDIVNTEIERIYKENHSSADSNRPLGIGGGGGGGGGYAAPSTLTEPKVDVINETPEGEVVIDDLEGYDWAKEAINYLRDNNIMLGDGNGMFRPGDNVTREELAKLIVASFGLNKLVDANIFFTDVSADEWYCDYIETAYEKGVILGIREDYFGVGQSVTRQDAATMIQRALDAYFVTLAKKQEFVNFTDYDTIADYAVIPVDILARAQIISGYEDGTFRPNDSITRAEIAKMLYACLNQ